MPSRQSWGIFPVCIDAVKRSLSGVARFGAASFNSLGGISSGPASLSGSNLARKCSIIVGVKLMLSRVNLKFCRGKTGMSSSTWSVVSGQWSLRIHVWLDQECVYLFCFYYLCGTKMLWGCP